jgi:hypothetical protein
MGLAIAAGAVAIGGAVTTGIMSSQAASKAAGAAGAAGKKYKQGLRESGSKYEQALKKFNRQQQKLQKEVKAIDPNLNIRQYNLQNATPEGIEAANQVTANTLAQLEKIAPGSAQARQQAGLIINRGLSGQPLSEAQIGEIQRMTAMGQGAASYNPAMAGRGSISQRGIFDYARALGSSMYQVEQEALGNLGRWQDLALRFYQQPTQMMALGEQGMQRNVDVAQANFMNQLRRVGAMGELNQSQLGAAQDLYAMQTGQAGQIYQTQQQINEAAAARDAANIQATQGVFDATSGALAGMGSAYGQFAQAQGASTTPTSAGFYKGEIGAANAYGVAPSQLSYQKPTGGFMGLGGTGGGYYYTPGGVYGRA